jgi:hypothetical protein
LRLTSTNGWMTNRGACFARIVHELFYLPPGGVMPIHPLLQACCALPSNVPRPHPLPQLGYRAACGRKDVNKHIRQFQTSIIKIRCFRKVAKIYVHRIEKECEASVLIFTKSYEPSHRRRHHSRSSVPLILLHRVISAQRDA